MEEIAHLPLLGRKIDALFVVKQHPAVQLNMPPVRGLHAGNALERQALPAAGGPQQAGHAALGREAHVQPEGAQILLNFSQQTHFSSPPRRAGPRGGARCPGAPAC